MTDVYIVRHGNTFDKGDTVTRVGARTDLPLSTSGLEQAHALAAHFKTHASGGFELAYCSILGRTRQTAEAILEAATHQPSLQELAFLKEIDYGPDENQPENLVIRRLGQAAIDDWDEKALPPQGWEVDPEALIASWQHFFAGLVRANPKRPVLVVTSNGIARFALNALDTSEAQPVSIKLKTGAYGKVQIEDGKAKLISWNIRP